MKSPLRLLRGVPCSVGLWVLMAGCSGRRLPPGTPPPEYEPPVVTPWSPDAGEVEPSQPAEHASASTNSTNPALGAELSLDAGSR
jgi:hypothetical protein